MFNQISYNVVIERFKVFADGHFMIRRFSHGQVDVTDIDKDQLFPWMHVAPVDVRLDAGARVYSFDVIFADMPRDKEDATDYQREVISDCVRLCEDLVNEIANGLVVFGEDVELEEGSTITPFIAEYTHTLCGATLAISISVPNDYSACDIPADWSIGGSGSATPPSPAVSLVLKVNGVDNVVQDVLDLEEGANMTITDLGDGRVRFDAGGGGSVAWGAITGTLSNQTDLQNALNLKADISSLGAVAFSNDYNDLDNLPTIPGGTVTSVGLSVPTPANAAFGVSGSPIISSGTLAIVANGTALQYIDGTAALKTFPDIPKELGDLIAGTAPFQLLQWDGSKWVVIDLLSLDELKNVNAPTPSVNEVLTYNGTEWIAQAIPAASVAWGDITGTLSDQTDLQNALDAKMTTSVYDSDVDGVVDASETVQITVRNSTGVTLEKGQVVYLSGATGNRPNAILADASTEPTSSKTIGFVLADIANNTDGQVAVSGTLHDLDTQLFTAGDTLWLSETPGEWQANTPPAEPAHAVFLGYVARSHPNLGRVVLAIQNGYELNELHGVSVPSPSANDVFYYNGGTSLWQSRQLTASHITDSTTVGQNLVKLANPNAISFLRVNADNTVTARTPAQVLTDLGVAGTIILGRDYALYNVVNTTTNTIATSVLIPANTLQVNDFIEVITQLSTNTGNGVSFNFRLYVNTSASLTGATQIGIFTNTVATGNAGFLRNIAVTAIGASGNLRLFNSSTSSASSYGLSASNPSNITIDTTVAQYLIFAIQMGNNTSTAGVQGTIIRLTR